MKVKELIEILKTLDQNLDVILSSDQEGNSYSKARVVEECMIDEEGNALHPEDDAEYGDTRAVVIWP